MTEQRTLAPLDDIYRQLAQRLDALPNRFPASQSGVEYRLLKKIFTEEEAALACVMHLAAEPAADIASRAGMGIKQTRDTLKRMVAKGLIDLKKGEGQFAYAVRPFVVGFYEGQLPRMDIEMAGLFEEYFRETQGGILRDTPALHRVIPIGKAIPFQVEIHPYERATELLEGALSWGVRDCICRKQQQLLGKGCSKPIEACLVFAPIRNAFDRSKVDRAITKEEALEILRRTEEAGLVHSSGNYRNGIEYICNCCTCCCGIMRGIAEYGISGAIARSDFHIAIENELCSGCGVCVDRCQFHALSVPDGIIAADDHRCMGCGLCVLVCPTEALHLNRRQEGEVLPPPIDINDWRTQRST
jgi:Na+-translocating ferredoxin:NAD+ oxidoreductase subunit B